MARSKPLVKAAIALGVLGLLGFLFMRSVRSSRSAPYSIARAELAGWTVMVEPSGGGPTSPVLTLRAPAAFTKGLFNQVFHRAMESLASPADAGIPLVLRGELDRGLGGRVTPEALLAAARAAGLDGAPVAPRCMGLRRISTPTSTRHLYFVLFDMPAFARFRQEIGALAGGATGFDPAALSPAMPVASPDSHFDDWLPLRADAGTDCVAPIAAE